MEKFPSIVILQHKIWKTVFYFSMFCFYCLISWKISPNSDQIRNCGSWIRSARFWDTITIRIVYKHVLDKPVGDDIAPVKAKKRRRPPVVMTKTEVRQVLNQMKGTHLLMAKVMHGGGLRLLECLRLRVMDLDFAKSQVYVRGKGGKDRFTTLSPSIYDDLKAHLLRV